MSRLSRVAAWLAGVWGGGSLAIGAIAAPAVFASGVATPGLIVGRMFAQEAGASLVLAMLLFIMLRRLARDAADAGHGSVISGDMLLALGALFCTVAGYYALQPLMEAARAGQGRWSYGQLHAVSASLYLLKTLLVLALAWRVSRSKGCALDGARAI